MTMLQLAGPPAATAFRLEMLRGELRAVAPAVTDVAAHFEHFVHLGLEWLHVARRTCPAARIVLTLHEYLAMCAADGQMLKRGSKELCYRSDPDDCARCFPGRSAADFFLRREFIRAAFDHVDHSAVAQVGDVFLEGQSQHQHPARLSAEAFVEAVANPRSHAVIGLAASKNDVRFMAKFLGAAPLVGLRRALGASKSTIFRQHLVEVGVIGFGGGLIGIGVAALGLLGLRKLYELAVAKGLLAAVPDLSFR